MANIVRMPAALAQVTEGAVQTWLVEVGQEIKVGDLIAEIETEKAVVEFASEVDGTVGRLLVRAGQNVEVGTPILVVTAAGETDADIDEALAEIGSGTAEAPEEAAPTEGAPSQDAPAGEPTPSAPRDQPSEEAAPEPAAVAAAGGEGRVFASPLARRLARERHLDLSAVVGTGPGGRITRRDLDAAPATAPAASAAALGPVPAPGAPAAYEDIPLTGMRKAIARRLPESKSTAPHFYVTAHARVDALLELRKQANEGAEVKISVNDFVLKAVAAALVRVPAANAIWNGDSIRRFSGVDIGVAIAIENGLVTPVVRGVERRSLGDIQRTVADFAARARAGRLKLEELEGGSFSVSNLGMYGVDEFSAILNPPQSGILAVSAAKPRPVVGEDGQLAVANVMTVTLSADHRVVDGAVAAEWMAAFVDVIEHPVKMLV
ncbi:MAG: pyruvate dehydrogenase complex dihydrolipoamide acetyltransferase [Micrococcales bacterium 73-13]|nr:MAG: pyruvate dehydrogenase complex dihydrolipoamide acetyltransferase [Micrococcales bacterium 73-13]